jgi:hypothetical protein
MSDGQGWGYEMQLASAHQTEQQRGEHAIEILADEIQSMAYKVRTLVAYAPGRSVPQIVSELQDIGRRLRGTAG